MKKISVIYITYNRSYDLKKSLDALKKQEFEDYEVIVVDQASDDNTSEIIKEYKDFIRYIRLDKNLGVAGGRNIGAQYAKGEYLVFIDDDAEFINNDALEIVYNTFENDKNINIIAFNIYGNPEESDNNQKVDFEILNDKLCNSYIGCGHAIRNKVFSKLNGYSEELFFWGEEIEFALKTFTLPHNKILFKGDIILWHRVTNTSRINWSGGRFFYKVRNRINITNALLPKGVSKLIQFYYRGAYFIRAIQVREFKQYFTGIKDSKRTIVSNKHRLTIKQFIKYKLMKYNYELN